MYCRKCGKAIEGDSEFCRYCGAKVDSEISVSNSLLEDELGKKSVIENIKSIKISLAENNKITLNNKELHIEKSSTTVFVSKEKERIKKEIESVL